MAQRRVSATRRLVPLLPMLVLVLACAEPPQKEMDRAEGAIDAARAAGAEEYAAVEFAAATGALDSAREAVTTGDYRLALNHALSSHERAQNAARETADAKARIRADAEHAVMDIEALIATGQADIRAAERVRTARPQLAAPASELTAATGALQKARELIAAGDYLAATKLLEGVRESVRKATEAVSAATASQSLRRPR